MLPAYKPVRKLYFNKLSSFSVLTLPVNVKRFDRKFEGISFQLANVQKLTPSRNVSRNRS